jgi:hypothetical protein
MADVIRYTRSSETISMPSKLLAVAWSSVLGACASKLIRGTSRLWLARTALGGWFEGLMVLHCQMFRMYCTVGEIEIRGLGSNWRRIDAPNRLIDVNYCTRELKLIALTRTCAALVFFPRRTLAPAFALFLLSLPQLPYGLRY